MPIANPEKGEYGITIGGREYVLVSSFNGMLAVQQTLSTDGKRPSVGEILTRVSQGDLESMRALFWATLRRHHPDITLDQAGDLIDQAGGLFALDALLGEVANAGKPDPKDVSAMGGAERNPRRAAKKRPTGTGAR